MGSGASGLDATLRRYPQVWSRVTADVAYGALGADDVASIAAACLDMPLAPDAVESLVELSGGRPRQALQILGLAERRAKRARDGKIAAAHLTPRRKRSAA